MKKFLCLLVLMLFVWVPLDFAADTPPIPVPQDDGLEIMPPDLGQMTPVPLPDYPVSSTDSKDDKKAIDEVMQASPAPIPTPVPPPPAPETKKEKKSEPAATMKSKPTPKSPTILEGAAAEASAAPSSGGESASTQALLDYFPVNVGSVLHYQYLKPGPGETAAKSLAVSCESREAMPNGTIHASFQTTGDGPPGVDQYSLFGEKIQQTFHGDTALGTRFILELPKPKAPVFWSEPPAGGTVKYLKAVFGKAQVYQKTYPDCLLVTQKTLKGKTPESTEISYYAKGIGLVAIEVYTKAMKLEEARSLALVSEP